MVGTDGEQRYDVFLSYNSADHALVEPVARALKEKGLRPFLDRWHLVPGRSWVDVLETIIAECSAVAVFVGGHELGRWQQRERMAALDRQAVETDFPVIPVLLPGADDPGLGFLAQNTWVNLQGGVNDARALETLARAIRGTPPDDPSAVRNPKSDICPYRGLEPFREEDAAFFFGRGAFVDELLEKIKRRNFLMVLGASGSGKSSMVRAGLVPALRRGASGPDGRNWSILMLTPGDAPLNALAAAFDPPPNKTGRTERLAYLENAARHLRDGTVDLARYVRDYLAEEIGSDRLLLVVDQFEELYTRAPRPNPDAETPDDTPRHDRDVFVNLLFDALDADTPLTVVGTMRADFLGQALKRRDLSDRMADADVKIGPLSHAAPAGGLSEIETIIRKPAEAVSLDFEDGLVERILADVGSEPGNLPLLEFLLKSLWDRRQRGKLTHEAYDAVGGVEGAIAKQANTTFGRLDADRQAAARRLFLSLVTPGEGQEDTRARAAFPEDPDQAAIVQAFAAPKTRLLVTSEDASLGRAVEVSHEALIRNWTALRGWIEVNRDWLRVRTRIRRSMQAWEEAGRDVSLLLPAGIPLEEGRKLLHEQSDVRADDLAPYIDASIEAEETREREAAERDRKERDTERKLREEAEGRRKEAEARLRVSRWLTRGAIAAGLVLGVFVAYVYYQSEKIAKTNDDLGIALLTAGSERDRAVRSESRALASLSIAATEAGDSVTAALLALEALPSEEQPERVVIGAAQHALHTALYKQVELALLSYSEGIIEASFSNDDRLIIVNTGQKVEIYDIANNRIIASVEYAWERVDFTRIHGNKLIIVGDGNQVAIWSLAKPKEEHLFSAPHRLLDVVAAGETLHFLATNGSQLLKFNQTSGATSELASYKGRLELFPSPDGRHLVINHNRHLELFELETGMKRWGKHLPNMLNEAFFDRQVAVSNSGIFVDHPPRHKAGFTYFSFADGASTYYNAHDELWNFNDIESNEDGNTLLIGSSENVAQVLRKVSDGSVHHTLLRGHQNRISSVDMNERAKRVATGSSDGTARLWNLETGALISVFGGHGQEQFVDVVLSGDGTKILTLTDRRILRLWVPPKPVLTGDTGGLGLNGRLFSDNLDYVIRDGSGNHLEVVDAKTGSVVRRFKKHTKPPSSVVVSDDGRLVGSHSSKELRFWEMNSGSEVWAILGETGGEITNFALQRDGERAALIRNGQRIEIWDISQRRLIETLQPDGSSFLPDIRYSRDGKLLFAHNSQTSIRGWNTTTNEPVGDYSAPDELSIAIAISADGSLLAAVSETNEIYVWEVMTGETIARFSGHRNTIWGLDFSPDGKFIVSGSADGTTRVWSIALKEEIATFQRPAEHSDEQTRFSPTGNHIVTATSKATINLQPIMLDAAELVKHARAVLPRCLSAEQRKRYFLAEHGAAWCRDGGKWPYDAASYFHEARILLFSNRDAEAEEKIAVALTLDPELSDQVKLAWSRAYLNRSQVEAHSGNYEEAFQLIRDAEKNSGSLSQEITNARVGVYIARAEASLTLGEAAKALVDAEAAVELAEEHTYARLVRGLAYEKLGRDSAALEDLNFALETNTRHLSARIARARVNERLGKSELAITEYREILATDRFGDSDDEAIAIAEERLEILSPEPPPAIERAPSGVDGEAPGGTAGTTHP